LQSESQKPGQLFNIREDDLDVIQEKKSLKNPIEVKVEVEQVKHKHRLKPGYFKTTDKKTI